MLEFDTRGEHKKLLQIAKWNNRQIYIQLIDDKFTKELISSWMVIDIETAKKLSEELKKIIETKIPEPVDDDIPEPVLETKGNFLDDDSPYDEDPF